MNNYKIKRRVTYFDVIDINSGEIIHTAPSFADAYAYILALEDGIQLEDV